MTDKTIIEKIEIFLSFSDAKLAELEKENQNLKLMDKNIEKPADK